MATKKTAAKSGAARKPSVSRKGPQPQHSETYDTALRDYAGALELLRKGDLQKALEGFDAIIASYGEEPELVDRARTYRTICARRTAGVEAPPKEARELYYRGVVMTNEGRLDEAIELFGRVLAENPRDAGALFGRASAFALQGRTESAVADLREAMSIEPTVRFQAANDPDFDQIRDDAAFIDVIEPTPAGA